MSVHPPKLFEQENGPLYPVMEFLSSHELSIVKRVSTLWKTVSEKISNNQTNKIKDFLSQPVASLDSSTKEHDRIEKKYITEDPVMKSLIDIHKSLTNDTSGLRDSLLSFFSRPKPHLSSYVHKDGGVKQRAVTGWINNKTQHLTSKKIHDLVLILIRNNLTNDTTHTVYFFDPLNPFYCTTTYEPTGDPDLRDMNRFSTTIIGDQLLFSSDSSVRGFNLKKKTFSKKTILQTERNLPIDELYSLNSNTLLYSGEAPVDLSRTLQIRAVEIGQYSIKKDKTTRNAYFLPDDGSGFKRTFTIPISQGFLTIQNTQYQTSNSSAQNGPKHYQWEIRQYSSMSDGVSIRTFASIKAPIFHYITEHLLLYTQHELTNNVATCSIIGLDLRKFDSFLVVKIKLTNTHQITDFEILDFDTKNFKIIYGRSISSFVNGQQTSQLQLRSITKKETPTQQLGSSSKDAH